MILTKMYSYNIDLISWEQYMAYCFAAEYYDAMKKDVNKYFFEFQKSNIIEMYRDYIQSEIMETYPDLNEDGVYVALNNGLRPFVDGSKRLFGLREISKTFLIPYEKEVKK